MRDVKTGVSETVQKDYYQNTHIYLSDAIKPIIWSELLPSQDQLDPSLAVYKVTGCLGTGKLA
jgi:hypothetical protein